MSAAFRPNDLTGRAASLPSLHPSPCAPALLRRWSGWSSLSAGEPCTVSQGERSRQWRGGRAQAATSLQGSGGSVLPALCSPHRSPAQPCWPVSRGTACRGCHRGCCTAISSVSAPATSLTCSPVLPAARGPARWGGPSFQGALAGVRGLLGGDTTGGRGYWFAACCNAQLKHANPALVGGGSSSRGARLQGPWLQSMGGGGWRVLRLLCRQRNEYWAHPLPVGCELSRTSDYRSPGTTDV